MAEMYQPDPTTTQASRLTTRLRRLSIYEYILVALMTLAVIGVGINYFLPAKSYTYWMTMVPVFGIACTSMEWSRLRRQELGLWKTIRNQIYHWFGVLVAVYLVHLLFNIQQLTIQNAGLIVLLVLGLGTFLAGVQLGWRLFLLGVFLWIILVMAAYLQGSMWILILVGLLIIAILIYWRIRGGVAAEVMSDTSGRTVL
ncbi:MAG: hypothetical protein WAL90_19425 [Desulfobacterales bacterium]